LGQSETRLSSPCFLLSTILTLQDSDCLLRCYSFLAQQASGWGNAYNANAGVVSHVARFRCCGHASNTVLFLVALLAAAPGWRPWRAAAAAGLPGSSRPGG
jgi:hypothetical protein